MNDIDCPEAQIMALLQRYCWTVDHQLWDEWTDCFEPEGVFAVRGNQLRGRSAIEEYVKEAIGGYRLVAHLQHLPEIELTEAGAARARSYFELRGVTGKGTDVEALGQYEDQLVHDGSGWRFKLRKATFKYYVRRGETFESGGGD